MRYLPDEGVYVVQLGHFRGQIEVEEAAFFVRGFDATTARDPRSPTRSREPLDPASLRRLAARRRAAVHGEARSSRRGGLPARFLHAAQAELLHAVEETPDGLRLRAAGGLHALPESLARAN